MMLFRQIGMIYVIPAFCIHKRLILREIKGIYLVA